MIEKGEKMDYGYLQMKIDKVMNMVGRKNNPWLNL